MLSYRVFALTAKFIKLAGASWRRNYTNKCELVFPKQLGLGLSSIQLAPAARADVAFDEFARVRRLKIDAAVAALIAFWRSLIFGVRLADLLLRRRLGDRRGGCRGAKHKRRTCERRAARDALGAIFPGVIHDRTPIRCNGGDDDPFHPHLFPYSVKT
jgi:hypothetical protein